MRGKTDGGGEVKDTHPTSDLIGWFTTTRSTTFTPTTTHLKVHQDLLTYNESLILLLLNPTPAAALAGGGKLPVAIFETVYESDADHGLRFVPLPFTIESGEAEMIGMDFVAKGSTSEGGGGGAAAATVGGKKPAATTTTSGGGGGEESDLVANLVAKRNAVKMLNSRIKLLLEYVQSGPAGGEGRHAILREIKALTKSRLALLVPDREAWEMEKIRSEGDVELVVLLGAVTRCIEDVRGVGRKSAGIDAVVKNAKKVPFDEGLEFGGRRRGAGMSGLFGFS